MIEEIDKTYEQIENKIDEIIKNILNKNVNDISKNEFDMLMTRLSDIRLLQNEEKSKERMIKLFGEIINN